MLQIKHLDDSTLQPHLCSGAKTSETSRIMRRRSALPQYATAAPKMYSRGDRKWGHSSAGTAPSLNVASGVVGGSESMRGRQRPDQTSWNQLQLREEAGGGGSERQSCGVPKKIKKSFHAIVNFEIFFLIWVINQEISCLFCRSKSVSLQSYNHFVSNWDQEWISRFSKRTLAGCAGYKRADWLCEAAGLCPPPGSCLRLASSSRWWTAAPRRPGGGLQPCTPAPWAHRTSGSVREDKTDLCLSWRTCLCQSALKIKGNIRITNF